MSKYITCIFLVICIIGFSPRSSYAKESDPSGTLRSDLEKDATDYRIQNLSRFLKKYDSPLEPYAEDFVAFADINNIDYRLVPAITGVESTFGKQIPSNSYNAYGWANGDYSFKSWEESIEVVTGALRKNYFNKGATTVSKIARIYAPPSTTWSGKVEYFMAKIDPLPVSFDL